MLTDLYQRAYTELFPTVDCYCGVKVAEARVRKTVAGEWEYRLGEFHTKRYDARTGEPHNFPFHCSREDRARALKRNQQQAIVQPRRRRGR